MFHFLFFLYYIFYKHSRLLKWASYFKKMLVSYLPISYTVHVQTYVDCKERIYLLDTKKWCYNELIAVNLYVLQQFGHFYKYMYYRLGIEKKRCTVFAWEGEIITL